MKHLARLLSLLILVSAGILFANCGGEDDPKKSEQEKQFDKLKGEWTLQSVEWTGDANDTRFDGATVTLNVSGTFSENAKFNFDLASSEDIDASPWPDHVQWKFASPATSQITRLDSESFPGDDDVALKYTVSGSELTFEFLYSGSGFALQGARAKSTDGTWTFTFTK